MVYIHTIDAQSQGFTLAERLQCERQGARSVGRYLLAAGKARIEAERTGARSAGAYLSRHFQEAGIGILAFVGMVGVFAGEQVFAAIEWMLAETLLGRLLFCILEDLFAGR